jgi:hypothetical protein
MTNTAPDLSPGYPSRGTKLGPAWNDLWAALSKAKRRKDAYLDGRELAGEIAQTYDLNPATLIALMSRMAKGGHLDREQRPVQTNGKTRNRTHYRIPVS